MKTINVDLLIVGSGMVGASLALALAKSDFKVGIIEARTLQESNPTFDDRAIALAYGSKKILDNIGIWDQLSTYSTAIQHIHISNQHSFGFSRLHAEEEKVSALGYVVTAKSIGDVFLKQLKQQPNIEYFCPARLTDFKPHHDYLSATIEMDGETIDIHCKLLIGADGVQSTVRKKLKIAVKQQDYGHTAITTNVEFDLAHQGWAYERFSDQGPLAILPMQGKQCGVVWTQNTQSVENILTLPDDQFKQQLQQAFGYRLGAITKVGTLQSYPLQLMLAKQQTAPRVVLIGNAAHALHPIAGQGYNLGLRDVSALAEVLIECQQQAQDIGGKEALDHYQSWRTKDQQRVSTLTDNLVHIFSHPSFLLRLGRNIGLLGVDLIPSIKHLISQQAMGLCGKQPKLSRGVRL